MELGRVITPEVVREALDLARDEFFAARSVSKETIESFTAETEYASYSGPMLAGNRQMWACRDGGRLRGFLSLDDARDVGLFFVSGAYRRHGIGRALVAAASEHALGCGSKELRAFVPLDTEHFFVSLGFERCGQMRTVRGLEGVDMRCDITV